MLDKQEAVVILEELICEEKHARVSQIGVLPSSYDFIWGSQFLTCANANVFGILDYRTSFQASIEPRHLVR